MALLYDYTQTHYILCHTNISQIDRLNQIKVEAREEEKKWWKKSHFSAMIVLKIIEEICSILEIVYIYICIHTLKLDIFRFRVSLMYFLSKLELEANTNKPLQQK